MIVFHHNDADGRCAAAVAYRWWQQQKAVQRDFVGHAGDADIRFVEMDYKMPCPVDQIRRDETVVIVDFSFKPDVMAAIRKATDVGVIWCDHHATAKDYHYAVPGFCDFADKGKAGCECAWLYFFPHEEIPDAIQLLGDYDAWRMQRAPECLQFYEGLKLEDTSPRSELWPDLFDDFHVGRVTECGATAIRYRDNYCQEMRQAFGYKTKIDGVKAFACNVYRFGSPGFGELFQQYPVCIAYAHDGERFTVSLYSQTEDVGAIAKNHGGGGHWGAAGFICTELPWKKGVS